MTKLQYSEEWITPARARAYLELNKKNRKVKPKVRGQYRRDMLNGDWGLTGECIIFDSEGTMRNGQHRLEAIASLPETQAVLMSVIRGISPKDALKLDSGVKRSAADQLKMNGYDRSNELSVAASLKNFWDRGYIKDGLSVDPSHISLTNSELVNLLDTNQNIEDGVEKSAPYSRQFTGTFTPAAIELFTINVLEDHAERLDDWMLLLRKFKEWDFTGWGGSQIQEMRKQVDQRYRDKSRRDDTGAHHRGAELLRLFNWWNAYAANRPLPKFSRTAVNGKGVKLPELIF